MAPEDRDAIRGLVVVPGRVRAGSPEGVLRHFGTTDGQALGLSLLADAVARRDDVDLEYALVVCSVFGISLDHQPLLLRLSSADWHQKHEDVVSMLGRLRSPLAVHALYAATQSVPPYLEYDGGKALTRKAIRALGGIPGPDARQALLRLADSGDETVREWAQRRLGR